MAVPGFWDPRRRPERPDLSRISIVRFLTETDYPPFNYAGPDGAPAGFNIDLAADLRGTQGRMYRADALL
jgi:polar amino acid transport system substrate-binding protein